MADQVALERQPGQFSFWDAYLCADFATYPSLQEGWGNQLLEAIWAKLPVALYEYPVFRSDIAPVGFRYVSLGSSHERDEMGLARVPEPVLRRAVREFADLLASPDRSGRSSSTTLHWVRLTFPAKPWLSTWTDWWRAPSVDTRPLTAPESGRRLGTRCTRSSSPVVREAPPSRGRTLGAL